MTGVTQLAGSRKRYMADFVKKSDETGDRKLAEKNPGSASIAGLANSRRH
jgi:hypothetical protein